MTSKRQITRADIWPLERYSAERAVLRKTLVERKRDRRLALGPDCTFYFESYDTMWAQIQEMLYIERGGEAQIADELSAYNPLVPKGDELVATVMFEIDDKARRTAFLATVGGIEERAFIELEGERLIGRPEEDVDRTSASGKASSVQFIHFPFTPAQAATFKSEGARVVVGFDHPEYAHMTVMPEAVRAALSGDLD